MINVTLLPQEDTPVGHRNTSSDLSFDKQQLGMQKHTIHLDNVNICIEILIRDDPAPAKRSSLKSKSPRGSSQQKKIRRRVYAEVDLLN